MKNLKNLSNEEFNRLLFEKIDVIPYDQKIDFKSMDILRLFTLFKVEEVLFHKVLTVFIKIKHGEAKYIEEDIDEVRDLLKDFSETRNSFFGEIIDKGEE